MPYFIATASVQQVHVLLSLHAVTFSSKSVMVEEQEPVRVVLMEISSQLVEMVVLQLARILALDAALGADLCS